MARKPRTESAGAIHHVYARGVNKEAIVRDDRDRRMYLEMLGLVVGQFAWQCLAYCLMGNHMHLLVETAEPNLGDGMRELHGKYARALNDRHRRNGHLFQ